MHWLSPALFEVDEGGYAEPTPSYEDAAAAAPMPESQEAPQQYTLSQDQYEAFLRQGQLMEQMAPMLASLFQQPEAGYEDVEYDANDPQQLEQYIAEQISAGLEQALGPHMPTLAQNTVSQGEAIAHQAFESWKPQIGQFEDEAALRLFENYSARGVDPQ